MDLSRNRLREIAFLVAVVSAIIVGVVCGLGCAGPIHVACHDHGAPYTSERPTRPFKIEPGPGMSEAWFADGAPTVLTVHNPTDRRVVVRVVCEPSVPPSYIDYGHIEGYFDLEPHQEAMRLVEFMNRDSLGPVCRVAP